MSIKIYIGKRVKKLRETAKLTQEQLALSAGLDRTYINSVENGRRNLTIESIEKICRGLKITIRQFFSHKTFM